MDSLRASSLALAITLLVVGCGGSATVTNTTVDRDSPPVFATTPPTALASGLPVKPGLTYEYRPVVQMESKRTYTLSLSGPSGAELLDNERMVWRPALYHAGQKCTFVLTATSSSGLKAHQSWELQPEIRKAPQAITVTPIVNGVPPVEGKVFRWRVAFEDDDPGSVQCSFRQPAGALYDPATKLITWTPPMGAAGSAILDFELENNVGLKASSFQAITIEKNPAPTVAALNPPQELKQGTGVELRYQVTDPNGDAIREGSLRAVAVYSGRELTPAPAVRWDAITKVATMSWAVPMDTVLLDRKISLVLTCANANGVVGVSELFLTIRNNLGPVLTAAPTNPTTIPAGATAAWTFVISDPERDDIDTTKFKATVLYLGLPVSTTPTLNWDPLRKVITATWKSEGGAPYVGFPVQLVVEAADAGGHLNQVMVPVTVERPV